MPAEAEWDVWQCKPGEEGGEGIPDEGPEGRDGERWERLGLSHSHLLLQSPAPWGLRPWE